LLYKSSYNQTTFTIKTHNALFIVHIGNVSDLRNIFLIFVLLKRLMLYNMTNKITEPIKINSSSFGEIEIQPDNIFYFENGLLGFETLNNFVLISDEEIAPFKWLMAIEEPEIMFPIISPFLICEEYNTGKDIDSEHYVLFSVVTFNDGNGNVTANLKAPIVLCSEDLTGEQIIITAIDYNVNQIISSSK